MTNVAQPDEGSLPAEIAAATGTNSNSPNVSDPLDVSASSPGAAIVEPDDTSQSSPNDPGIDPLDVSGSQPAGVSEREPEG